MREIKFRAWDLVEKQMNGDVQNSRQVYTFFHSTEYVLMQYTGLKDKNGKEIYEGDILKTNFGRTAAVVWYRRGFFVDAPEHPEGVTDFLVWEQSEIIGNIYENPELLTN